MVSASIKRILLLCDTLPALLHKISLEEWNRQSQPDKWSKKQILGHLVDSATNNHQRFIRVQYEERPMIVYDQDKWNALSHYQSMNSQHLIMFWTLYNRHLAEIIKAIPVENYDRLCRTNEANPVTLGWLITDYVKHMEYHLHQIIAYEH